MSDDTNKIFTGEGWTKKLDNPLGDKLKAIQKNLELLGVEISRIAKADVARRLKVINREKARERRGKRSGS